MENQNHCPDKAIARYIEWIERQIERKAIDRAIEDIESSGWGNLIANKDRDALRNMANAYAFFLKTEKKNVLRQLKAKLR